VGGNCQYIYVIVCESLKESSKYQFVEGYYKVKVKDKVEKLYVLTGGDTIKAYREKIFTMKRSTPHMLLCLLSHL